MSSEKPLGHLPPDHAGACNVGQLERLDGSLPQRIIFSSSTSSYGIAGKLGFTNSRSSATWICGRNLMKHDLCNQVYRDGLRRDSARKMVFPFPEGVGVAHGPRSLCHHCTKWDYIANFLSGFGRMMGVSLILTILLGSPIFAETNPDFVRKQFFVENYVEAIDSNPKLFIKHLAHFNYAVLSEQPNTPESKNWNRAGQLFERMELDRGIVEFFKNGSSLGIGLDVQIQILPSLSVDATNAIIALGKTFIGYGSISEEQISKEARDMVANKTIVRGVGETIYDAYFNRAEYPPMNRLNVLVGDLDFKPDSSPQTYIEMLSVSDRLRLNASLSLLPEGEAEKVRNDFSLFSDLMWSTFWGTAKPSAPLDEASIDSILLEQIEGGSLDYHSFGVSLLESDPTEQRLSFTDWWRDNFEPDSSINSDHISEQDRAGAALKVAQANTTEFKKMMGYLRSISASVGADTRNMDIIEGFGLVTTSVEELRALQAATKAKLDVSTLQMANGYLGVFSAGVGLMSALSNNIKPETDIELQRFMALYNNQIEILEDLDLVDRRVRHISLVLLGMEEKIISSEYRIREDLARITSLIERFEASSMERYDFLIAADQQEAITPLLLEWRSMRDDFHSGQRGVALRLSAAEDFLIRRVANPPFVSIYPERYRDIASMRPQRGTVGMFIPVANIVMAAERYGLDVEGSWRGLTAEQGALLAKRVRDFLARYSEVGPSFSKDGFHHNDTAFAGALLYVVDLVATNGPGAEDYFPLAEARNLNNRNQKFWRSMVEAIPVLAYSIQEDLAELNSEFQAQQHRSLELLTGHKVSEIALNFVREFGPESFAPLYVCMKSRAVESDPAYDETCSKFEDYVLWDGVSPDDAFINLLQDLNILDSERIYALASFTPSKTAINYCKAYCFRECADVASGFAWSRDVYNRYFAELGYPGSLIAGYVDSIRTVCQSFPPLDDVAALPKLWEKIFDIGDGACSKPGASCVRSWEQFFKDKIWPVYFLPRMSDIYSAPPELLTEYSISSRRGPKFKYPPKKKVSSAVPPEKGYGDTVAHENERLDYILVSELKRISDGYYSHLKESKELVHLVNSIDDEIWSIKYLFSNISPECQNVLRRHLPLEPALISDAAEFGFKDRFRGFEASKDSSGISMFLSGTQLASQDVVVNYMSAYENGECYMPSEVAIDIESSLEFIERVMGN